MNPILLTSTVLLSLITLNEIYKLFCHPKYIYTNSKYSNIRSNKKNILLVITTKGAIGGGEVHAITLYETLMQNDHNVIFFIAKNSGLEKELIKQSIPYYRFNALFSGNFFQPGLYSSIYSVCNKHTIDTIMCNVVKEIIPVKKVAKKLNIKTIFTRHLPQPIKQKYSQNLDAIIGVSPKITQALQQENIDKKLNIKEIIFISPFFNQDKFLNFKTNQNKYDFFKNEFNIALKNCPLVCMVGNMNRFDDHKNHPLLFNAIAKLIHEKNIPIQVALAGTGKYLKIYKKMILELKIQDSIYFLGTTDKIAELMYHSNINLLTSMHEAFGIVALEAALLKKPIIWPTQTDAANVVIFDNKTGLLFENNNVESLVGKIEMLLSNVELQKQLGQNAYDFVKQNFSIQANMKKMEELLNQL